MMLTLKHEVILKMKESFYRGENQEYLLYFPGAKICGHSYFQWFHNHLMYHKVTYTCNFSASHPMVGYQQYVFREILCCTL